MPLSSAVDNNPGMPGLAVTMLCALMVFGSAMAAGAQPPAGSPFTLADALARARDGSPEAAAARARVDAADRAVEETARMPNPTVEFRSENWASGVSRSVLPLDTFAEITQVIELGGKRGARRGVAEADLGAMQAHEAMVRRALAVDISRAYLDALRLRERQRTLAAQSTDLAEMVRVLDRRVEVGTTAESDVLKLRTEEARLATDLLRTEVAAQRALVQLTSRLNVEVGFESLVRPSPPALPVADDEAALKRRPDVTAAERAVVSAQQALRLEDARGTPDPALNAGYKRTGGYDTGLFTVTMPIPLWDRNRVARILAQGQVTSAELERAAVERRARGELAATRTAAGRLGERAMDVRARLVEPALGARQAARAAFAVGALDVLRLVDAERVFTDATLVAIDIEIDAVAAAIEARLAAGEDPLP
jgi:outer membrane protein, heavy metal efflux system